MNARTKHLAHTNGVKISAYDQGNPIFHGPERLHESIVLPQPTGLPVWFYNRSRQFFVGSEHIGIPFPPLPRAPTRRVRRDVYQMGDLT